MEIIVNFVVVNVFTSFLATVCIFSMISAFSSAGYRLGTSPVLRIILMSSINDSSLIWLSANRKVVGRPSPPHFNNNCRRERTIIRFSYNAPLLNISTPSKGTLNRKKFSNEAHFTFRKHKFAMRVSDTIDGRLEPYY